MNEISIIEAWTQWFSGHLPSDATIWGVSIFWWGRIGKIMQAIGGVTIIADIIGPEKIRSFGTSLHGAITPTTLIQFLEDCSEWYTVIFRHTFLKDYADEITVEKNSRHIRLNVLNYGICFLLTALVVLSTKLYSTGWFFLIIEAAIIFVCLLVSVSPLLTVLTIATFALIGLIINSSCVEPLAWFLEHPSLDRFTKIASLLLLLIGFHFELLAS